MVAEAEELVLNDIDAFDGTELYERVHGECRYDVDVDVSSSFDADAVPKQLM